MLSARDCRRKAEECEFEALDVTRLAEVRQFRILARAWRELAEHLERRAEQEPRSFNEQA